MQTSKLSTVGKVFVAALVGLAIVHLVSTIILNGEYSLFSLVLEVPPLVVAGFVIAGKRWAVIAGVVLSGLLFVLTATGAASVLAGPLNGEFIAAVLFLLVAIVAVVTGIMTMRAAPN